MRERGCASASCPVRLSGCQTEPACPCPARRAWFVRLRPRNHTRRALLDPKQDKWRAGQPIDWPVRAYRCTRHSWTPSKFSRSLCCCDRPATTTTQSDGVERALDFSFSRRRRIQIGPFYGAMISPDRPVLHAPTCPASRSRIGTVLEAPAAPKCLAAVQRPYIALSFLYPVCICSQWTSTVSLPVPALFAPFQRRRKRDHDSGCYN